MIEEGRKVSVYTTMSRILTHLNSGQEQRSLAGNLAAIRNSIGKGYEDATEVWPILFPLMPQEYLGNGPLNYEEKALISVLQLYALGQQGSSKVLNDAIELIFVYMQIQIRILIRQIKVTRLRSFPFAMRLVNAKENIPADKRQQKIDMVISLLLRLKKVSDIEVLKNRP